MRFFKKLTRVTEAWARLARETPRITAVEELPPLGAVGRVVASPVEAPSCLPRYSRAAYDGYAVRSADVTSASPEGGVLLRLVGEVDAGEWADFQLGPGDAARVSTGAPLPPGADAVVPLEHVEELGGHIVVHRPVPKYGYVSVRCEDVEEGAVVASEGAVVTPELAALLHELGVASIRVFRRPVVAVASTGDEVVASAGDLGPGKVVDFNRPAILARARAGGFDARDHGILGDERSVISSALDRMLGEADLVVLTGGASVGRADVTRDVVEEAGRLVFHGIAMRPGMPAGAAVVEGKPVLLTPGSPAASVIVFKVFGEPLLHLMQGSLRPVLPHLVVCGAKMPSTPGLVDVLRVVVRGGRAFLHKRSGSMVSSSVALSHGVVIVPEDSEGVEEGERVELWPWDRTWTWHVFY